MLNDYKKGINPEIAKSPYQTTNGHQTATRVLQAARTTSTLAAICLFLFQEAEDGKADLRPTQGHEAQPRVQRRGSPPPSIASGETQSTSPRHPAVEPMSSSEPGIKRQVVGHRRQRC